MQYKTIAAFHLYKSVLENRLMSPLLPDFEKFADTPDDVFFGTEGHTGLMWKWVEKAKSAEFVGGDHLEKEEKH